MEASIELQWPDGSNQILLLIFRANSCHVQPDDLMVICKKVDEKNKKVVEALFYMLKRTYLCNKEVCRICSEVRAAFRHSGARSWIAILPTFQSDCIPFWYNFVMTEFEYVMVFELQSQHHKPGINHKKRGFLKNFEGAKAEELAIQAVSCLFLK